MPNRRERPILKGIKHGRSCYVAGCGCEVGRIAEREYQAKRRRERGRANNGNIIPMNGRKGTESEDSLRRKAKRAVVGPMEQAVIDECAQLDEAKKRPTVVIAACNIAKIIDDPDSVGMHNASTKQLMALLDTLRPKEPEKVTGKRKSGGRLATVGNLTKVKRQGA